MDIGLSTFPTTYSIPATELGREAEQRGFDAVFAVEHTHVPASRRTPYPLGGDLPSIYWESYEPFTYLSQLAAVTSRLRVGTGVCLVAQHHPVALAKRAASLDAISGGRFLFGVGAGWLAEEMENHGFTYDNRWKILREHVLAMQSCWTQKDAEFHGEYVNFDPVWVEPKPVTNPHPPILIGANSKWAIRRIAEYAQGWYPVQTPDFDERLGQLRDECEKCGRSFDDLDISLVTMIETSDQLEALKDKGVNRVVLSLPTVDADESKKVLDGYQRVIEWARELRDG